jgi:hypothetical protein
MFVLRVDAGGRTSETSCAGAECALGSFAGATVCRGDAGWAGVEAWAWEDGTTVVVVRGDGTLPTTLRVGESVALGRAQVTLARLVPSLEEEVAPARAPAAPPPEGPPTPPPPPRRAAPTRRRFVADAAFGDELVASLERAPWIALSAALHALVLFVLAVAMPSDANVVPREPPRVARFEAPLGFEEPVESGPTSLDEEPAPPEPPVAPEDLPPVVETDPADRESATPPVPELLELPHPVEPPPTLLGTSLSITSLRTRRTAPRPPADPAPPLVGVDVVNHDHEQAPEQNRRAAAVVMDAVRRRGGHLAKVLRGLRPEDVLVVKGAFDEMEKTLDALNLPYTLRAPADLEEGYDLGRHRAVFWNCGEFPTRVKRAPIASEVRRFVQDGGFLFTTDWMVSNLLEEAFPGYVGTQGRERPLPEAVVGVRPVRGQEEHPLLEGVFHEGTDAKWWLEATTHGISVKNSVRVETLIESPGLSESLGAPSDAVAVTFTYGNGRVLHLLGHYYQKEGSIAGTIAAQRIALNFLGMRLAP